jgi:hypothetical protein
MVIEEEYDSDDEIRETETFEPESSRRKVFCDQFPTPFCENWIMSWDQYYKTFRGRNLWMLKES